MHTLDLEYEQEQRQSQALAAESLRLDGVTDAAFGCNPNSKNVAYLDGYFSELRRRVEDGEHIEIRWLSPAYLSGGYDSPYEF